MKKYHFFLLTAVAASMAFTSCDEDRLDIPQKGVSAVEDFYKSDDDALSALTTIYADTYNNFSFEPGTCGWNYSPYFLFTNGLGDDIFFAGSDPSDCSGEREFHDFRMTTANGLVEAGYTIFYRSIDKCNLLISNFTSEERNIQLTPVIKQCIAEARVMRAFDYMMLGIYYGRPPVFTEPQTAADNQPNAESQDAVFDFVVSEIDKALPDLIERKNTDDYEGAVRITKGFANAVKGKTLIWQKKWSEAKKALEEVINSGKYALVPSDQMHTIGHASFKGSSEIVFEFNLQTGGNVQPNQIGNLQQGNAPYTFNWRYENLKGVTGKGSLQFDNMLGDGWGWINPSKSFCDALIENDGMESARRKAWIISYDEMLYDLKWASDGDSYSPGKTDTKASDKNRGIGGKFNYVYGNCGYFAWKTVMHEPNDNIYGNWCGTWNRNFTIMRYAEVLLLYAEACAQNGETSGPGLDALNEVQKRAQSKTISSSLSLKAVQTEKLLEMWQEGCRGVDQIRWGLTASLEKQDWEVPVLHDRLNEGGSVHEGYVVQDEHADVFKNAGAGFKPQKNELLPFPLAAIERNSNLEQNPGW